MSLEQKLGLLIEEVEKTLEKYNYDINQVFAKDIIDYFSFDAPSGDVTTISDIIENKWLLLHEFVELSELKKKDIPISEDIFNVFYEQVLESHICATEWEFSIAKKEGDVEWIKQRIELVKMWIQEDDMSSDQIQRFNRIVEKYSP